MNKPIKAKNLPLFSIIDLDQLRREKHLEMCIRDRSKHRLKKLIQNANDSIVISHSADVSSYKKRNYYMVEMCIRDRLQAGYLHIQIHALLDAGISGTQSLDLCKTAGDVYKRQNRRCLAFLWFCVFLSINQLLNCKFQTLHLPTFSGVR